MPTCCLRLLNASDTCSKDLAQQQRCLGQYAPIFVTRTVVKKLRIVSSILSLLNLSWEVLYSSITISRALLSSLLQYPRPIRVHAYDSQSTSLI